MNIVIYIVLAIVLLSLDKNNFVIVGGILSAICLALASSFIPGVIFIVAWLSKDMEY